jgi:hypothetical protein
VTLPVDQPVDDQAYDLDDQPEAVAKEQARVFR